jgi:hypothetical protein
MAIVMNDYVSNQINVEAVVITASNLGEVVQEFYDNGIFSIVINQYNVNPLDITNDAYYTGMMVSNASGYFSGHFGDYLVKQEINNGTIEEPIIKTILSIISKEVFESNYTIVV